MAFLSSMVMMCLLRGGRGRQGSSPQRQAPEVSLPLLTRGNSPAPWIRQKHTVESWGSCSKIHMRIIIQIFTVRNLKAFMLAKGRCLSVPYSSKFWSTLFFKQNNVKTLLLFSCSVVSDSLQPHGPQHSRLPCPSVSLGVCSNSCPNVMPSNHLILCHPRLLLPSIFPSIRVFSNESALRIR